ncbi:2-oxo-3-hexenedioate decarboxylase [Variovorax sp. VNK109]|jgi:2-oxo-3-hexenedioate decarboxylase|uniref:2-oxo-3-hexenedioate decarboxylase n=1 Tax=Variovorax sp. VNK109 TaxID=3400919 RepID=UPI003C0BBBF9
MNALKPSIAQAEIERLAAFLHDAETGIREVEKITDELPALTHDDAYAIQNAILERKLKAGARLAGRKMGLTSPAKMKQMGVEDPIHGFLTADGCVADGAVVQMAGLIHPKVEAEIAFTTTRELAGPDCSAATAMAAIGHVSAAIEVIDSRYRNFRFDLVSVIADNTSAARYVIGADAVRPDGLDLRTLGVVLEKNGDVLATGAGAAVLGHPAASLAALVNMLAAQGKTLPSGTLVMTGGVTEAFAVQPGDSVRVTVQGVGSAAMRFA